jgi:hypothetical protein
VLSFLKKKNKSIKMEGLILSVDDNQITIRFFNTIKYKKGQFVTVGIPKQRMTALGKIVKISEIIACGEIVNVNQDTMTISSKRSGPIIARLAIKENYKKKCDMIVDRVA